jgi:hypothetical protein
VAIRHPDDTHKVVRINTAGPYQNPQGEQEDYQIEGGRGYHDPRRDRATNQLTRLATSWTP